MAMALHQQQHQQQQEEHDATLLCLLREDRVPLADVLHWLHAHHGPGPPPSFDQAQLFPPGDQGWWERLGRTTPQSFAVTFLNCVRAEVQPLMAVADSVVGDVVVAVKPPAEPVRCKVEPETNVAAPTIATENASGSSKGGKDRRKSTGTILQAIQEPKRLQLPVYDDDFPALGNVNVKKTANHSKQKRRVNPTPMVNPVVDSAFILAKVEAPMTPQQNNVNKSKLSSAGPVKVDMDVLMQRCEVSRKQKQKEKPEALKKENTKNWSWEKFDSRLTSQGPPSDVRQISGGFKEEGDAFPAVTQIVPNQASTKSVLAEPANPTGVEKESAFEDARSFITESLPLHCLSNKLTNLASVHATLMVVKLVPSLLDELHFLLQLLSLEPALSGASPSASKSILNSIAESKLEKEALFVDGDDCAGYATLVLEQAGRILDCVGEQILVALIEEPAIARHSPTLLVRLKASLADQQAAALRSFKAYETASRTNGVIEQSSTAGTVRLTPGLPVSLPFQAARDSRNIFKTQEEQRAYNNREQCRDQFYAIIREAASAYSAFGFLKMKDPVRDFLQGLLVENYPWFAELFLEQVLQASNCGETDPEVTSLARQDPAKLQRLHDRLTSTNTSRLPAASQKQVSSGMGNGDSRHMLSPGSPWSKVKSTEQRLLGKKNGTNHDFSANNVQILNKGRDSIGNGRERSTSNADSGSKFSSYFPQFLCVYVWFLEAVDSHRLNTQMMWSIKGKITVLTQLPPYSRDAADIGSGFTQRVLALKALAGLLGYLFVSPGAGARPPTPGPGAHDNTGITLWDMARSEPPVDVPAVLSKAQLEGSVLLNLPWILEFLRLLKADWLAVSHPQFQSIVFSLRDLYLLPMLNPSSEQFGVGSICILASLDAFFEYMDLTPFNGEWSRNGKAITSPVKHKDEGEDTRRLSESQAEERSLAFKGLDTTLGIIDSRYIQHCCPLLMELRGVLVEGKKRRSRQREPNWPDSPGQPRARTVRKITPLQRPGPSQSLDISTNLPTGKKVAFEHAFDSQDDQLKLKLQRTFLEQRPHLRRVVDFLVDTAASNAARAAVLKVVPPALQNAQEKLQMVLRGNGGDLSPGATSPWSITKGSQVETAVEHIITTTIHQLLGPAMDYAKGHAADRTAEALAALADPEESAFVLSVAAGIAAETAGQAAYQKAMASISGEIRKRITDDVETWRRKSLLHGLEAYGGSPMNASRRMRAQSWPRAGILQQLPAEHPDQLENGFVQEVSGFSDQGSVHFREPEDESSQSRSTDTVDQLNSVLTSSSMRTAKPSMAVKRQLSFSFKDAGPTGDEDQNETLVNGASQLKSVETHSRRWSVGSSLVENGQMTENVPDRRWSVGSSLGDKRPTRVFSLLDRTEEHDSSNGFAVIGELTGPQIFAARIAEASSNACYYCSVKPFQDESRHFLRQHLAIICISLEGLLSRIPGAIPAGGFDALVFNQDSHMQRARLCEEASSNPDTSRNSKLQLQVERGLARRSVALAVHLLLWNPSIVLDSSSSSSSSSDLIGYESNFLSNGSTSKFKEETTYASQDAEWCIGFALTVTWKKLVEAAILSEDFLLQELLTPWRWKLAMTSQPWQGFVDGFFEDWSVSVQKGIASVLIGLIGSTFSQGYEIKMCAFVRAMSEKNIFSCENGATTSASKATNMSSVRTKQDRLVNRTESLAAGLAVFLLQHYSPDVCIDKFRSQTGPSKDDAEGRLIPLRKLVENLFLEGVKTS